MRKKTRRQLELATAVALPLGGACFCLWAVMSPVEMAMPAVAQRRVDLIKPVPAAQPISRLVLSKRLQGPAPTPKAAVASPAEGRAIPWPPVKLENVFMTQDSPLAVLSVNSKTYRCFEGDKAGNIVVDEIRGHSVVVSYQGQKKTISLAKKPRQ